MTTSVTINKTSIELVQGDITQEETDAIVNAANTALAGGGGVDGAIHRAAGATELQAACRKLGGCATGDAKITPGFKLKARFIIHAVGPVYQPGNEESPRLLASAYRRSLEVAVENGVKTIAFPAISTGVYGYPMDKAAQVSLTAVADFVRQNDRLEKVRFVLFGSEAFETFKAALRTLS